MASLEIQQELDRLAAALSRATDGERVRARTYLCSGDSAYAGAEGGGRLVETALCGSDDEAVAELRAILRADTGAAISEAVNAAVLATLDGLALAASASGPITAEMLREMARKRRAK